MGFLSWLNDPMKTGANNGQNDPKPTPSRWFDLGNARVNAENKNLKRLDKKARKKEERNNKPDNRRGFFF